MLNIDKLNNKIFELVPTEINFNYSSYYKTIPTKLIDGKKTYIFDNLIPSNKDFRITKHDRFIPVPSHVHNFIEMNYIYSGTCAQEISGTKVILKKGDICIIDTAIPHKIEKVKQNDIMINVLFKKEYFNTAFFENLSTNSIIYNFLISALSYTQKHNQYIIFHPSNDRIPEIFEQILQEKYFPGMYSDRIFSNYINILFINLLRTFKYEYTGITTENDKLLVKRMAIMRYIEQNYDHCTLKGTAQHFNYSPNYLSYLLKKSTAYSFTEIVRQIKFDKVKFLLLNSEDTIEDIASKCGFSNLSFFYKQFEIQFKTTPRQFRILNK